MVPLASISWLVSIIRHQVCKVLLKLRQSLRQIIDVTVFKFAFNRGVELLKAKGRLLDNSLLIALDKLFKEITVVVIVKILDF